MQWGVGSPVEVVERASSNGVTARPFQEPEPEDDSLLASGNFYQDADKVLDLVQKISRTLKTLGISNIGPLNLGGTAPAQDPNDTQVWNEASTPDGTITRQQEVRVTQPPPPMDQNTFNAHTHIAITPLLEQIAALGLGDKPIVSLLGSKSPNDLLKLMVSVRG